MSSDLIKRLVNTNRESILQRLPRYLSAENFFQLCYALDRDAKLTRIAQRNPESIMSAILKASDCGLVIGSVYEHCWLIPYADEVQFQIGWRGLVYQWIRAGAILSIDAQCVYRGDHFEVTGGDDPKIVHRIKLDDPQRDDHRWLYDPANISGAYAIATLPTGGKARKYCPKGEIEFARSRSPGARKDDSPWRNNYPAMARKTPIRRLNGVIQVCGPTPENREAWERYTHTLEIDRNDFRLDDETAPEPEDDLPGARPPRPAASRESQSAGGPPSTATAPVQRIAQAPEPATASTVLVPPDEGLSVETRRDLSKQAAAAHITASELLRMVRRQYRVPELAQLSNAQAAELGDHLRQRLEAGGGQEDLKWNS